MVAVTTIQKPAVPEAQIVGVVLLGNPFWQAGKPHNKGTAVRTELIP